VLGAARQTGVVSTLRADAPGTLSVDVLAPVYSSGAAGSPVIGVIVAHYGVSQLWLSLLEWWPGESATAETVVVRRIGDEIVYLSRGRQGPAATPGLRLYASLPDLPADAAVRAAHLVDGVDYRGRRVVAVARQIPDSDWFLIAKIDADETYADSAREMMAIAAAIAAGILAAVALAAFLWRAEEARHYRERLAARETTDRAIRCSEERYRAVFDNAPIGILVLRPDGVVLRANPAASSVAAPVTSDGLVGANALDLPSVAQDAAAREVVAGAAAGQSSDGILTCQSRTGAPVTFRYAVAPVLDDAGSVSEIVVLVTDITAELASQQALRDSESRYRTLVESMTGAVA
jgi:PAS domain S-box-containing protein